MHRSPPSVCRFTAGSGRSAQPWQELKEEAAQNATGAPPGGSDPQMALSADLVRGGAARRCGACKKEFVLRSEYLAHFRHDPVCRLWAAAWPELHEEAQRDDDPDLSSEAMEAVSCPGCGARCRAWGAHIAEEPSCYHALPTELQQAFQDDLWSVAKTEEEYQEALAARGWV